MRFLKNKVSLVKEEEEECIKEINETNSDNIKQEESTTELSDKKSLAPSPKHEDISSSKSPKVRSPKPISHADSKNIIKNYGKALCGFSASNMALPYINKLVATKGYDGLDVTKFMKYMKAKKETTNSMENLRKLLIEEETDNNEQRIFKRLFKDLSIIFLKFFSVNWIYSGRLVHKHIHLKFRFKMLRRIKNPELFTYLKGSPSL